MMLEHMLHQLEEDMPALTIVWRGSVYGGDIQGKLALMFNTFGINKETCIEVCGYGDMLFTVYGIKVTYDKSPNALATEYMDAYEEITFAEKMYKYIISNFDNDCILFKLL